MRNIVAFYQNCDTAQRVKDELISANFDRDNLKIYDRTGDRSGLWESIKEAFGFADEEDRALYDEASRRGACAIAVSFDEDDENPSANAQRAMQIMQRFQPIDLEQQAAQWRQQGWTAERPATATTSTAKAATTSAATTGRKDVIPVVQEELQVGKRQIERGGIRIYTRVTQRPVQEQVNLREEHVSVERRPVDRPLTDADRPFQERTIEAHETSEQAVINKQPRVVEEVTLKKDVNQRTETVRDTVRRTDVQVEKLNQNASHPGTASASHADEFVSELETDQRYRGRDWDAIENDVRTSYERRYPGSTWEKVKDEVRRAYNRVRSKV